MPKPEARAWWADVEHLRETYERRRALEARTGARRAPLARAVARADEGRALAGDEHRAHARAPEARRAERRPARAAHARPLNPAPRRRTIEITGRTVPAPALPRMVAVERRRPPRRPVERVGPRPDRIASWAVVLGFILIIVAATS